MVVVTNRPFPNEWSSKWTVWIHLRSSKKKLNKTKRFKPVAVCVRGLFSPSILFELIVCLGPFSSLPPPSPPCRPQIINRIQLSWNGASPTEHYSPCLSLIRQFAPFTGAMSLLHGSLIRIPKKPTLFTLKPTNTETQFFNIKTTTITTTKDPQMQ